MKDPLQGSMIVLHGPPKVGKTQLASKFPGNNQAGSILWLATEPGHRYIPEVQIKHLTSLAPDTGWDTFKAWCTKKECKTIVVDTISGLYNLCTQYVCKKNNWEHPSDGAHGKGWNAVRTEFYDGLNRLAHIAHNAGATLILIDHSKEETIQTTTENIVKVSCAMPGQARSVVLPVPDHIWFLGYNERDPKDALKNKTSKRTLFVNGGSSIEAGCRDPKVKVGSIENLSKIDPYTQIVKTLYGKHEL